MGLLVVSGDITSKAEWDPPFTERMAIEMKKIAKALNLDHSQIVITPGNHDFSRPVSKEDEVNVDNRSVSQAIQYKHEDGFRLRNPLIS